jgi:hypothetical protein
LKQRTKRMIQALAIIGLGVSRLLLADDEPLQKVQISKTEHIEFPSGGVIRLMNSIGDLTVEGWNRSDVEITTVKSTKGAYPAGEREKVSLELQRVRVAAERNGDELVITTDFPRHRRFPPSFPFLVGATSFDLEYHIRVPHDVRLVVDHDVGEVHVDNLTGDIDATLLQGEIMLHLPEEGRYTVNAKSDFGSVRSDFPGQEKRRLWLMGHRILSEDSPTTHKLNLRVGFGDIIILKARVPKPPEPLTPTPKPDGL